MSTRNGSRSVSLIRKASIIGFGVRTLVRDIDLAKREVSEKVKQAGVGAVRDDARYLAAELKRGR
jgi:hypothetical protein